MEVYANIFCLDRVRLVKLTLSCLQLCIKPKGKSGVNHLI